MTSRAKWGYRVLVVSASVVACQSDLELDLEGKRCGDVEPRCLPGYLCSDDGICVRPDSLLSNGGAAGVDVSGNGGSAAVMDGSGGSVPRDSGVSPDASDASSDPVPRDGGTKVTSDAATGTDAGDVVDASSDPADACTPVVVYEDLDGDGVGRTAAQSIRCPGPGWSTLPGDCRDDLPDVHLGQEAFFGTGYSDPTAPEGVSFDYDCSGNEDPDSQNDPNAAAPDCESVVNIVLCSGSGYEPTARSGNGVSGLCGSATIVTCTTETLSCVGNSIATATPFRCK